jgi:hypothetical protein
MKDLALSLALTALATGLLLPLLTRSRLWLGFFHSPTLSTLIYATMGACIAVLAWLQLLTQCMDCGESARDNFRYILLMIHGAAGLMFAAALKARREPPNPERRWRWPGR